MLSVPDGLPRTRSAGRLEVFEWLWWAVAVDAFATLDEMVANGESRAAALDALEGYCACLVANIDEAVTFGRGWWEAAA